MKKKFIPVLAAAALVGLLGIASCGGDPTPAPSPDSSEPTPEPSSSQDPTPTPSSSSEDPTPTPEPSSSEDPVIAENPTLTIEGEKELTVAAGASLTLPTAKAVARDGKTDLSAEVSLEDYNDTASISADMKTFSSKIAGDHTISYYVEEAVEGEEEPRSAEDTIVIHVTAAHENTFVVGEGEDNPANVANYGTFKEGFEKGIDAPLYKALGDANGATSLSGTDEAIEGNSLIIDFNKTAGSALNAVFLNAFTKTILRGKAVTYKVSFDYKALTEGEKAYTGGIYFGLRWDNYDGTNAQFMADKTVGKTNHYETTFTEAVIPSEGNAGFFFFALNAGSEPEAKVAIDNFTVTAVECVETTDVVPTSEELTAEGGFTFNWKDKANKFGNGETLIAKNIEDETIKTAITSHDGFGENVMHLVGRDNHLFNGLNATNLVAGKKLTVSFKYYAVFDESFNMIVMAPTGMTMNDGLKMTVVDGKVKQFVWSGVLPSGITALNFYPLNASFDIYMGDMNVQLTDADPVAADETAKGFKVGQTWSNSSRSFGALNEAGKTCNVIDTPEGVSGDGIGASVSKIEFITGNNTVEWYRMGQGQMEAGHEYKLTCIYYIDSAWPSGTRFMYNFDNADFVAMDASAGYHKSEITFTATHNVDFFSFYVPEADATNAIVYVASTTVELVKINK